MAPRCQDPSVPVPLGPFARSGRQHNNHHRHRPCTNLVRRRSDRWRRHTRRTSNRPVESHRVQVRRRPGRAPSIVLPAAGCRPACHNPTPQPLLLTIIPRAYALLACLPPFDRCQVSGVRFRISRPIPGTRHLRFLCMCRSSNDSALRYTSHLPRPITLASARLRWTLKRSGYYNPLRTRHHCSHRSADTASAAPHRGDVNTSSYGDYWSAP
jgi:hypothetical protein